MHVILASDQGFHDDLADLRPDGLVPGHTGGLIDTLFKGWERDLGTTIECVLGTLLALLILIILGAVVLLNGHISQVNVLVILVSRVQTERYSGEATEAISIQESLQRVDRGDHHVDAHVKFVPVDQQGVLDVLLHHDRLSIGDLREVIHQGDTSTPALGCGLHDPIVVFALLILKLREAFQEVNVLLGQDEGQRGYVEDLLGLRGHLLGHLYVPLKEILPTHVFRTTEVVATLPN